MSARHPSATHPLCCCRWVTRPRALALPPARYLWVSRRKMTCGITYDWVVGCAHHNKDLSDGECGALKHLVDRVNLEFNANDPARLRRIETARQAYEFLVERAEVLSRSIIAKRGVGVSCRFFYFVPAKTISRPVGAECTHPYPQANATTPWERNATSNTTTTPHPPPPARQAPASSEKARRQLVSSPGRGGWVP